MQAVSEKLEAVADKLELSADGRQRSARFGLRGRIISKRCGPSGKICCNEEVKALSAILTIEQKEKIREYAENPFIRFR